MHIKRQFLIWGLIGVTAFALYMSVQRWGLNYERMRWANFLVGDPHTGFDLFQSKGCAHCHAVNGVGARLGPDLGFQQHSQSGPNQLVAAMWNHAPRMWERMRTEQVAYPELNYEEVAHLFAYLYTARYVDEPGNEQRGEKLFVSKDCVQCHAIHGAGGSVGPDLNTVAQKETPIEWTQAMWDHAPVMQVEAAKRGIEWPKFQDGEMNDLLAYIRGASGGPRQEFELLPANPDHGWQLFQSKSCIVCHAVKGEGGHIGPELGPAHQQTLTFVGFAGAMWNHSPQMWSAMKARNIPRPTFTGREMADLIAFLQSVRYFEPGGSPRVGEILFTRRGCSNCHGAQAEGSKSAPALRIRGRSYTAVTLASELWEHGPKMYARAQELKQSWPTLTDSDIGDLVVFLDTPPTERK